MKYSVANPIYDSVFKFLMEDERIAKIILSALLKKEVLTVEIRRQEHPNITHDKISMFRIDFAARVKENDGSSHLILIELQKTWVDTEVLRFRRYLAAQYNAEENMQDEHENAKYGIPMVAVYLLGHRIGDINEAVVYVNHKAMDYNGKEVENGDKDPFINSLTHDSIIVQIPLLHGKINNKLDKVLSFFDQTQRAEGNQQLIFLNMENYEGDSDMMYIIHRLNLASMSAEVRQEMNDEDEFYSVIEARDTQVMNLNKKVTEQLTHIKELGAQINMIEAQITEKDAQITEKDAQITEKDAQINEKDAQINEKDAQINEKDAQIKAMVQALIQKGLSKEDVSKITNLSIKELEKLI